MNHRPRGPRAIWLAPAWLALGMASAVFGQPPDAGPSLPPVPAPPIARPVGPCPPGPIYVRPPWYYFWSFGGDAAAQPPIFVFPPSSGPAFFNGPPPPIGDPLRFLPQANRQALAPAAPPAAAPPSPRRTETARSNQLVRLGDRLFKADNLKRAEERYLQSARASPDSAKPWVRLAQVSLLRGDYTEAAERIRQGLTCEPGWLAHADDIVAVYGEPADFHAVIARLETHLQVRTNDRDAWLVLGTQWYLSGQTRKAADVFLRLSDRKADPALAAFLAAGDPAPP